MNKLIKNVCLLLPLMMAMALQEVQAQESVAIEELQESTQPYFSRIHSNLEFYNFNANEHALYWVSNAKLNLGKRDYLNIELVGVYHQRSGESIWTPGDLNLTYTRDFSPADKPNKAWQGMSASAKLIMPTGSAGNAGLFGHWILEPTIQYSWRLRDERFFISNRWRYNFPLANTGDWSEPPIFIRFEPQLGYQDKKWSASVTLDNRTVFNRDAYVIFARVDVGYQLNSRMGINSFYTRRVRHTELFNTYAGVGLYFNL